MKKLAVFFCIFSFILTCGNSYAELSGNNIQEIHNNANQQDNILISSMPMCTKGNLICVLGKYTFTSNNADKPIYANNGIMCTTDGGICTDGIHILSTSGAVYQ